MFNISANNQITISRGDNASCSLYINCGTLIDPVQYVLLPGDNVYFSVSEYEGATHKDIFEEFNSGLIRKIMTNADLDSDNEVVVSFIPTDTQTLLPGTYWYSIKIKKNDGTINTIIDKTKFIIEE